MCDLEVKGQVSLSAGEWPGEGSGTLCEYSHARWCLSEVGFTLEFGSTASRWRLLHGSEERSDICSQLRGQDWGIAMVRSR